RGLRPRVSIILSADTPAPAISTDGRSASLPDEKRNSRRLRSLISQRQRLATYLCKRTARRYRGQTGNTAQEFSLGRRNRTREARKMKTITQILSALAVVTTSGVPMAVPADAHSTYYTHRHRYHSRTYYAQRYCRRSSATTGTVVGGVTGALVGRSVLGHGLLGT